MFCFYGNWYTIICWNKISVVQNLIEFAMYSSISSHISIILSEFPGGANFRIRHFPKISQLSPSFSRTWGSCIGNYWNLLVQIVHCWKLTEVSYLVCHGVYLNNNNFLKRIAYYNKYVFDIGSIQRYLPEYYSLMMLMMLVKWDTSTLVDYIMMALASSFCWPATIISNTTLIEKTRIFVGWNSSNWVGQW